MSGEGKFIIKMMFKTDLANEYGVSINHIKSMLKATREHLKKETKKDVFGDYSGRRYLTINQITLFVSHNGLPYAEAEEK